MTGSEIIGGVEVRDPYRWLEDDAAPEVIDWQEAADAVTVNELAGSPHHPTVEAAVQACFEDLLDNWAPQRHERRWFRTILPPGRTATVVETAASPEGPGKLVFDPGEFGAEARTLLYTPSPDGERVLVQFSVGAAIRYLLVDTDSGVMARDFGVLLAPTMIAWRKDGSGFFHRRLALRQADGGQISPVSELVWQPVEGEAEQQQVTLDDPAAWPVVSSDGRWVAAMVNQGAPRPLWVRRLDIDGEWRPFLSSEGPMYKGVFVGDAFWAITDDTSGWCRLVSIPMDTVGDLATWRELRSANEETKLGSITRCGDYVALTTVEAGVMRLRSLDLEGRELGEAPLPGDGAFGTFGLGHILMIASDVVVPDGDGCILVHSALDRGCGVYRVDLANLWVQTLQPPAHRLNDRVMDYIPFEGPNGLAPYRVMRKASTALDGSAPILFYGYGGYNLPQVPHYNSLAAAWTELGGVWVHAHIRGGGERDTAFWQEGRMERKQGAFDDFAAIIEDARSKGWAPLERTGIFGTSNGGLLVGATVTQRPDLVRAAVAQVPILDMIQCRKDPVTYNTILVDYGDPNDPADALRLLDYSPYHNVRPGVSYPALLCDAGADDTATPPWHSRKMTAAVTEATVSGHRVRLRVRRGAGHNTMTADQAIERDVEELVFLWDELS